MEPAYQTRGCVVRVLQYGLAMVVYGILRRVGGIYGVQSKTANSPKSRADKSDEEGNKRNEQISISFSHGKSWAKDLAFRPIGPYTKVHIGLSVDAQDGGHAWLVSGDGDASSKNCEVELETWWTDTNCSVDL